MRLWIKFSLFFCGWVLLSIAATTLLLTRSFVSDQNRYIASFQSSLASYTAQQLETEFSIFHSQLGALLSANELPLEKMGAFSAVEIWEKDRLAKSAPRGRRSQAPPAGQSRWALFHRASEEGVDTILWVGRYGAKSLVIEFASTFPTSLKGSQAATIRVVDKNGVVLIKSGAKKESISGVEQFNAREVLENKFKEPGHAATTLRYSSVIGESFLGTFLPLHCDPPVMISVTTPWSEVDRLSHATYWQAAGIAGTFLLFALLTAIAFSTSLTSPLRALVVQMEALSREKFTLHLPTGFARKDEVGILARAFVHMRTKLEGARDELRKSERLAAMGTFSAALAHEIKNPLTGILNNAEVIAMNLAKGERANRETMEEALRYVKEETQRADRIISRLLQFARFEKTPQQRVDIADSVKNTLASVKALLDNERIDVVYSRDEETPVFCRASADEIRQVLLNLIQNAAYAMRELPTKTLRLSLSAREGKAVLDVQDSGMGISLEAQKRLFEPFFTTKPIGEGTGLGLSVCYGIIRNHRGTIDVSSEVGKGTRFRISLPLLEESEKRAA